MKNKFHQVESDLIWYFNHSDAAIGFKSSHSSFIASLMGVSSADIQTEYSDGTLRQIKRLRRIRRQFFKLPLDIRRPLEACYNYECNKKYPSEVTFLFGIKSGAALFQTQVKTLPELLSLCRKKKQSKLSQQEEILMFNIGVETRNLWDHIHQSYLEVNEKTKIQL